MIQEFITSQMDLIFFVNGSAFLFLSAICATLYKRNKHAAAWHWLALFGLIQGLNAWAEILAIGFGDNEPFRWGRAFFLAVSFVCLVEFGRITCRRLGRLKTGGWIYLLFFAVISLAATTGFEGFNAGVRYTLGLCGGLWSAMALFWLSRRQQDGFRILRFLAWVMGFYAITAGLIVPKALFFPADLINHDFFRHLTGVPVQLLCVFIVSSMAIALWCFDHEEATMDGSREQFAGGKSFEHILGGIFFTLVVSGAFFVNWAGSQEAARQRADVLHLAQQDVLSLNVNDIKSLAGTEQDLQTITYIDLKSQLHVLLKHAPDIRRIYLMRQVGAQIILLCDSELSVSNEASLPGKSIESPSSALLEAFVSGKSNVDGPGSGVRAQRFCAYVPLNDQHTGKPVAVLGIDKDTRGYARDIAKERVKAFILLGLMCVVVIMIFLYYRRLMRLLRNAKAGDISGRWGVLGLVMIVGCGLTLAVFLGEKTRAEQAFETIFLQRAAVRVAGIPQALALYVDRLEGALRFYDHRGTIERREFIDVVKPMVEGGEVQAIEWAPRVLREQRMDYEARVRQDGFEGFEIRERDADRGLVRAAERDEYFPVYFVAPLKENENAVGFDLASNLNRRTAMEKSRDEGRPILSAPVRLVQYSQDVVGFLIFVPVYEPGPELQTIEERRKALRGFIVATFLAEEFLKGVYSRMPAEGLASLIEDPLAPADMRVLYRHKLRLGGVDWNKPKTRYQVPQLVAGREWDITVVPGNFFVGTHFSYGHLWIPVAGGVLTVLIALLFNVLIMGRFRSEKLIVIRTKELSEERNALRQREAYLSSILDNFPYLVWLKDSEGRFLAVNNAFAKACGRNIHQIIGKTDLDVWPRELAEKYRADDVMIMQDWKRVVLEEGVMTEGGIQYVETYKCPVLDNDCNVIGTTGFSHDITARKKAEDILRESEERFRQIASAITGYIYTVFIEDGKFGRVQYNPSCVAVTGYTAQEFEADDQLWMRIVFEKDRPLIKQRDNDILLGNRDIGLIEHRIVHKAGHIRWVKDTVVLHYDDQGRLFSYDGLITDISVRKEAEKVLADQKRALDEHAIVARADARGRITYVNDRFCQVSRYSREELIGKDYRINNSSYHPKTFFANMWRMISSGKVWQGKIRNRAKDGSFYWVQATITPFLDEAGTVKEYISAQTDITQSVVNEERLEMAMQVKTSFVSTVSHELRTPLASIKSSVDILNTEAPGPLSADQKVFLGRVKTNIDRLARLINDVLDLSKLESGKMTMNLVPLQVQGVVLEVVEAQSIVAKGKGISLETEFAQDMPVLFADKDRLIQVLNNLINNALKFTQQGKIVVRVSCEQKRKMVFCVSDTGGGIKPADLSKLFQKFQQVGGVSQQVSGTGLGLAISKEIVERHGGHVWVESDYGKGSEFFFSIPLKGLKRVLVVDDDRATVEVIKNILKGTDKYEIESASDGFDAGQKYLEFSPHLIILDIVLPKINGLEVCSRIKRDPKTMHTKVLMMSGSMDEMEKRAWEAGVDDVLKKPVDPEEMLLKVNNLI